MAWSSVGVELVIGDCFEPYRVICEGFLSLPHERSQLATIVDCSWLGGSLSCEWMSWSTCGRRAGLRLCGDHRGWPRGEPVTVDVGTPTANVERSTASGDLVTARRSALGSQRGGRVAVAGGHLGDRQNLVSFVASRDGDRNLGTNPLVGEGAYLCVMVGFQGPPHGLTSVGLNKVKKRPIPCSFILFTSAFLFPCSSATSRCILLVLASPPVLGKKGSGV